VVLVFLFLPLIDWARVQRTQAEIEVGNRREKRKAGGDPSAARVERAPNGENQGGNEKNAAGDNGDAWAKKRETLEKDLDELRSASQMKSVFYTVGMMVGFLVLAVASVLFLGQGQTTARRVVGGVVLATEMILVFITYLAGSSVSRAVSSFN
jgi:hypothetical protein